MPGDSASFEMEESYENSESQDQSQDETAVNNVSTTGDEAAAKEQSEETPATDNVDAKDNDERKMFVGGLSRETTTENMKEYFSQFGEVSDVSIKTDVITGRSRGFGFVLFAELSSLDKVVAQKTHTLSGRTIDPKRAKAKDGREPIKKIFIGGLDPSLPEDDIREYFAKFGKIEKIELPFDKIKNQRRGFCFITFESEEIVDAVCKQPKQKIGTKECDIKKATPAQDAKKGGFSGRGRGRGGYNQNQWSGWGGQSYSYSPGYGYGQGYGSYGAGYGTGYGYGQGYDYSGWADQGYGSGGGSYGYGSGYSTGQPAGYGKTMKTRARGTNFHPYNRQ